MDILETVRQNYELYHAGLDEKNGGADTHNKRVMPKRGTEDWYYSVLDLIDKPFRDFSKPGFEANAKVKWKNTDFSKEFFEEVFPPAQHPEAWKKGLVDMADVRMVMDPDYVRVENEAVLNGDKTVCS